MPRLGFGLALWALVAALSGCATYGKDFPLLSVHQLILGQSTRNDITLRFGPPAREDAFTMQKDTAGRDLAEPKLVRRLYYTYMDTSTGNAVMEDVRPTRSAVLVLVDDVLFAYSTFSSFKVDSTDFDLEKASMIRKGLTTDREVVAALGPPSGRGIYPFAATPGGSSMTYGVSLRNHPAGSITVKNVMIILDAKGTVLGFSSGSRVDPIPATTPGTPVYIWSPTPRR